MASAVDLRPLGTLAAHPRSRARALSHRFACRRTLRGGPTLAHAALDRALDGKHAKNAAGDLRLDCLHGCERQLVQRDFFRGRLRDDPAGDVVRLAERHVRAAHQPVGKIGGGGEAGAGGRRACARRRAACRAPCRSWRRATAPARRAASKAPPCLPACPSDRRAAGPSSPISSAVQRADDAAGLGAHQLGRIGIALLRHDRGAGGERRRTAG